MLKNLFITVYAKGKDGEGKVKNVSKDVVGIKKARNVNVAAAKTQVANQSRGKIAQVQGTKKSRKKTP